MSEKEKKTKYTKYVPWIILGLVLVFFALRECSSSNNVESTAETVAPPPPADNVVVLPPASPESDPAYVAPQPVSPPPTSDNKVSLSAPSASQSAAVNPAPELATSKYKGVISGDWGMTINQDSRLVYYHSNKLTGIPSRNPSMLRLNSATGVEGVLSGEYIIYTTNEIVTLSNIKLVRVWAIYLGEHELYSYPMYLPHEWQKLDGNIVNNSTVFANDDGGFNFRTSLNLQ
jgi:hypothetical protein